VNVATILVVEDNEKNLKLVRDVLQFGPLRLDGVVVALDPDQ
jgi:CheY-like chemotaxis protein